MNKRFLNIGIMSFLIVGILLVVLINVIKSINFAKRDAEVSIVQVGQYSITKSEIETYYPITQLQNSDNIDLKAAVLECVKEKLMEEEIKGTEYEITNTSKEDRISQIAEKFTEIEREYCEKNNVSKDEFIEILAAQDWYYSVHARHFTMFAKTYMQNLDEAGKKTVVADDIIAAHEEYLNNKIDKMNYTVVDENALKCLNLTEFKDLNSFLQNNTTEAGAVSQRNDG